MSGQLVLTELVDGVGIVTFDRPERHNAMNDEMSDMARVAMTWALTEPDVRCVLLRGNGPSFCSGRDTSQLGMRVEGESDFEFVRRHQRVRLDMLESPKPVVAAVQGAALGGGMEIALAADIRIAATTASFGMPEVGFGLVPDTGGTQVLTRLVGPARAKLVVIAGERVDAATALAWGLVERVVEPDALADESLALAKRLAAVPPLAAAMAKLLIDQAPTASYRDGFTAELIAQVALFGSADYREARSARRDGRAPEYRGS